MNVDKAEFWEESYLNNTTGWDLKSFTPAFKDVITSEVVKNKSTMLIPGCGKGYDAIEASKAGFKVTAIDLSVTAINFAEELAKSEKANVNFFVSDFFDLDETKKFEVIYDYTFYCAINPLKRKEYSDKICSLLDDDGIYIALLFPVEKRTGGPPFGIDETEFDKFFAGRLELLISTNEINTIKPRKGREILKIYRKK